MVSPHQARHESSLSPFPHRTLWQTTAYRRGYTACDTMQWQRVATVGLQNGYVAS